MRRALLALLFGSTLALAGAACGDEVETKSQPGGAATGGDGASGGAGATGGSTSTGGDGGSGGTGAQGGGGSPPDPCVPAPTASADKVDLLLVIDNSRSMADKQAILSLGVPELVGFFSNPRCLDPDGAEVANQPATPNDPCPGGSSRPFAPVADLHIGVISTSVGGHGSDVCSAVTNSSENDRGHLLDRSDPDAIGPPVPTYQDLAFLAWDPNAQMVPPGESNEASLVADLQAIIGGVGEVGCGFESQLESWYRFLVDPDPYATITLENNSAVLNGTDQAVLDQRADFLRPDSALIILMVSDENDCSTRDGGQFYFSNQFFEPGGGSTLYHLPKPRAACAVDPNDPCCRSCGQGPGNGCDTSQDDCTGPLSQLEDPINMRCFDQKRRFGIDFLYPIDRYVTAILSSEVSDRYGNLVQNPLYLANDGRSPDMTYVGSLVGVPWQDIARRDAGGSPDLIAGLKAGAAVGGLQNACELEQNGTWDVVLGDIYDYQEPSDPLMQESISPRTGSNPITGDALAPPGAGLLANPINGHEYSTPDRDDLQYACVFPLAQPKDCGAPGPGSCDCGDPNNDNPVCQAPGGQFGQMQYFAKAYPGRRELQLLHDLGPQGVVGSICPAQTTTPGQLDYAYRPLFAAVTEAVARSLAP